MIYKLCLICALSMITVGCKRQKVASNTQKAVSSTMTVDEQKNLNERLAKLEATLEENAPFVHAKLAPPATEDQLAELRTGLGGTQVQSLALWYQWHNGCIDATTNVLPLGRMLSISESLQDRKMIRGIRFVDEKRKSALKILDDGAGDGFFVDVTSPNPHVFYHMLEDPFPRDYGTLKDFVQFMMQVHAAGLSSEDEHGMVDFDMARYDKLESEYFGKLPDNP